MWENTCMISSFHPSQYIKSSFLSRMESFHARQHANSVAGTLSFPGHLFINTFLWSSCWSILCALFCWSLFVLFPSSIVLSDVRLTVSYFFYGIFIFLDQIKRFEFLSLWYEWAFYHSPVTLHSRKVRISHIFYRHSCISYNAILNCIFTVK